MATAKQIAANRRNAKKSTGPRTAEGKTRSSKNALKHGLTTPYGLLPGESEEEYMYHREELLDEFYPDSSIEHYLADRIVYLSWALKRAGHFIRVTLHGLLGQTCGDPLPDDQHPDIYLARMVVRDFADNHVMERLEIYERRIENSLYKTMREYEKQKKQSTQARRTHPRPSAPTGDAPNPFYAHAESDVGPDASHHSTPDPQPFPETENAFLKKRTQFQNAKIPRKPNIDNNLYPNANTVAQTERTESNADLALDSQLLSAILCSDDAH